MWEVKVRITISSLEIKTWEDKNEDGELEVGTEEVWGKEEVAAILKIRIDHTGKDTAGEYLPDDEVTYDVVHEAVEEWKQNTGLQTDEVTEIEYSYDPEKAKKVK